MEGIIAGGKNVEEDLENINCKSKYFIIYQLQEVGDIPYMIVTRPA
jgi:hypothetical protein